MVRACSHAFLPYNDLNLPWDRLNNVGSARCCERDPSGSAASTGGLVTVCMHVTLGVESCDAGPQRLSRGVQGLFDLVDLYRSSGNA